MPFKIIKILQDNQNWRVTTEGVSPEDLYPADKNVAGTARGWSPNTDIFESEDSVVIRVEVAGVKKEELSLKSQGDALIINGCRSDTSHSGRVYYHQMEISYGPFEKVIMLPPPLQNGEISAQFNDGILEIAIQKKSKLVEVPIATEVEVEMNI